MEKVKIIAVPPPVKIKSRQLIGGRLIQIEETITLKQFVEECCEPHKPFRNGPKGAYNYGKIMQAFEKANGTVELDEELYRMLKPAVENPEWASASVNSAYYEGGFYAAILDAKDKAQEQPKPEVNEETKA